MTDVYCLVCKNNGKSFNKVIKNAPAGLCCDACNSISVDGCDKLGGLLSWFKGASKCTQCGHSSTAHYHLGDYQSYSKAKEQLEACM